MLRLLRCLNAKEEKASTQHQVCSNRPLTVHTHRKTLLSYLRSIMNTRNKRTVFVGGLDDRVTEELLQAAFIPFGDIKSVSIPKDFNIGSGGGKAHQQHQKRQTKTATLFDQTLKA